MKFHRGPILFLGCPAEVSSVLMLENSRSLDGGKAILETFVSSQFWSYQV